MYIDNNQYFAVKMDTKEAIDITFKRRELNEANISRLHDDEVDAARDDEEMIISEVLFYYLILEKTGGLPSYIAKNIKKISEDILVSGRKFNRLNDLEYKDFVQIVKKIYTNKIPVFSD